MASNQRKSSDVMIEGRCATPIVLAMTALATRAELAVVPVVLPVTRYACRCELVAIEVAGVASIAPDRRVGSFQRKSCRLVMVEMDRAPLALVMAAIAFRAVPPAWISWIWWQPTHVVPMPLYRSPIWHAGQETVRCASRSGNRVLS